MSFLRKTPREGFVLAVSLSCEITEMGYTGHIDFRWLKEFSPWLFSL